MFKNADEIKKAVSEGKKVYWKNPAYQVKTFSNGTFIYCLLNGNMTGLTRKDGTMNENIEDFYLDK